jgi:hypothetical protein
MARGDKGYERRRAASARASEKDAADKKALADKMTAKGGAGKLSRKEIKLAKRTGDGEGQS